MRYLFVVFFACDSFGFSISHTVLKEGVGKWSPPLFSEKPYEAFYSFFEYWTKFTREAIYAWNSLCGNLFNYYLKVFTCHRVCLFRLLLSSWVTSTWVESVHSTQAV
jgi:hypothetical protein